MIEDLKFRVQAVLPTVYDDSLSYYELLNKVVQKLNEVIDATNAMSEGFQESLKAETDRVLREWLNDGTISGYLNNVVIVNDYGAKGDGVTDDTQAIQRCIDANPNSLILFKGGVYKVSDTIHLYNESGGAEIDFGGATVIFDNGSGTEDGNKVMFAIDTFYYDENGNSRPSRAVIKNGTLNGSHVCGVGIGIMTAGCYVMRDGVRTFSYITNHGYHSFIDGCKLSNFCRYAVLNGYRLKNGVVETSDSVEDTVKVGGASTQTTISNLYIYHSGNYDSRNNGTGIGIMSSDNQVSNIITWRLKVAYELSVGGNTFTNCHSTVDYISSGDSGDWDAVYGGVHILLTAKTSTTQLNEFIGCYFNVGKYVVFNQATGGSQMMTRIGCSYYIFYRTYHVTHGESCLCGGTPTDISCDNFDVVIGADHDFYGYVPSQNPGSKVTVPTNLDFIRNYRHSEQSVFSAVNLMWSSSNPILVSDRSNAVPSANAWYEIGAILFPYFTPSSVNETSLGNAKIEMDFAYLTNSVSVGFEDTGNTENGVKIFTPKIVEERCSEPSSTRYVAIDKYTKIVNVMGRDFLSVSVYMKATATLGRRCGFKIYGTTPFVQGFVRNGINSNQSPVTLTDYIELWREKTNGDFNIVRANKFVTGNYDVACIGDSLTFGTINSSSVSSKPYPAVLEELTGMTVTNRGIGGELAENIVFRGNVGEIVFKNGGNANRVYLNSEITDTYGNTLNLLRNVNGGKMDVEINGERCQLELTTRGSNKYGEDDRYTLSGYSGSSFKMPTRAKALIGENKKANINIFEMGTNNLSMLSYDVEAYLAVIVPLVKDCVRNAKNPIIIGLPTCNNLTREQHSTIDSAVQEVCGNVYIPMHRYLSQYGVYLANLTPTSQDISDMTAGDVPTSLMSTDGLHLNDNGYLAMGKIVANFLQSIY